MMSHVLLLVVLVLAVSCMYLMIFSLYGELLQPNLPEGSSPGAHFSIFPGICVE